MKTKYIIVADIPGKDNFIIVNHDPYIPKTGFTSRSKGFKLLNQMKKIHPNIGYRFFEVREINGLKEEG